MSDLPSARRLAARAWAMAAAWVLIAACASGTSGTVIKSQRTARRAPALAVRFRVMTPGNDSQAMFDVEAIVQGGKARLSRVGYPDTSGAHPFPASTFTYDGSRLLIHDAQQVIPYHLVEDAAHATDLYDPTRPALADIAPFLPFEPRRAYSQFLCPQAKKVQEGRDLGRTAAKYSCVPRNGGPAAIWVDRAFRIVLSPLLPSTTTFVADPPTDASTFSTTPPLGAKVETFGVRNLQAGDQAPEFTVTAVPAFVSPDVKVVGQPINSNHFAGHPHVVVFFDDSILFDHPGSEAASLTDLSNLTAGGTAPAVLGVIITATSFVDKGGIFASKGWHFRVAYDNTQVQHQFGFADRLDFAFINADGTVASLHRGIMSRSDLAAAIAQLK